MNHINLTEGGILARQKLIEFNIRHEAQQEHGRTLTLFERGVAGGLQLYLTRNPTVPYLAFRDAGFDTISRNQRPKRHEISQHVSIFKTLKAHSKKC